jgi:uncharacterized membrane protein
VTFANPLPWWGLVLVAGAAAGVAWLAYSRRAITPLRKYTLAGLRFITLLVLVLFLMRPVARSTDADARDAIVPVLVDISRSMGIEDVPQAAAADNTHNRTADNTDSTDKEAADNTDNSHNRATDNTDKKATDNTDNTDKKATDNTDNTDRSGRRARRIDWARQILTDQLLPTLGSRFHVEVLAFGESLAPVDAANLAPTARRSDLEGALTAVRDRYRGRAVAGIILLSDGGDTSGGAERAAAMTPPVFPIGVGSAAALRDREILSVTAAEAVLDDSRVDLAVSAVSSGLGTTPIELRLLENGRPIDVRRVVPAGEGTPVREVFQVSPGRGGATIYTVDTPAAAGELVPENNARSTLVQPPARARRVLTVEGAPGFEHSFLKRALAADTGLEVDSVVRKGKNEQGADTFYIQAARSRSDNLTSGYPSTAEALFKYDALVLANVEAHQFTRSQLDATRAFVGRRGGGLLVLGARSFLRQGLVETPLEEVLPLNLTDRAGGVLPASNVRGPNRVTLTPAGDAHPIMQLAPGAADSRSRWDGLPALASIAPLGGPRPGASVLAMTSSAGGSPRALVAVQRYGDGRAMVFAGEAAWRWRMLLPASERVYDTFWRQAVRWIALPATDPIVVTGPPGAAPGDTLPLEVIVRNASYEPQPDVAVDLRVTSPDGRLDSLKAAPRADQASDGRYLATFRPEQPGVYRVAVDVRRGATQLGSASSSLLVGGADLEMSDPRLNQELLQRVAIASGGGVLSEDRISTLPESLAAAVPAAALSVRRDLWNTAWSFLAIIALVGTEWILRRRWGLR